MFAPVTVNPFIQRLAINGGSPQARGLVAAWNPLPGGRAFRDAVSGRHMLVNGTTPQWDASPKMGPYLDTNMGADAATVTAFRPILQPLTMMVRYYQLANLAQGTSAVVLTHHTDGSNNGVRIQINGNTSSAQTMSLTFGGIAQYIFSTLTIDDSTWFTVAVSIGASSATMMRWNHSTETGNDETMAVGTISGTPNCCRIGDLNNSGVLDGFIAEARIYRGTLPLDTLYAMARQATRWDLYQVPNPIAFRASAAVVSTPYAAWAGAYPPFLDHARHDYRGWYARPTREPDDIATLSWHGSASTPARLPAVEPTGYYVRPLTEPDDIAQLGWRGNAPTGLTHTRPQPAGWYTRSLQEPDDIAALGWRGESPPWLETRRPHPSGWAVRPLTEPEDLARLGWRGTAPVWIARDLPDLGGWFTRPLGEPDDNAALGWYGSHPDLPGPQVALTPAGGLYVFDPAIVRTVPPLSWAPLYPDRALGPAGLAAALQQATTRNLDPITLALAEYGWRGTYPIWIDRSPSPTTLPSIFAPALFPPAQTVPTLAWLGSYPSWFPGIPPTILPAGVGPTVIIVTPSGLLFRRTLTWRTGSRPWEWD